ncbi:MAG: DNA-3-methyladenine glycosylase [Ginsengibacter sp.]
MKKLTLSFYKRNNVAEIAKDLLGKIIVTNFDGQRTSGRIVETEAYVGVTDKASHSYNGRRTARNEHMYGSAGIAYVYVCYGLHQMLNVVTNDKDAPDAVLIRAVEPLEGVELMLQRSGKKELDRTLTRGPGNLGKALGIFKHHSGTELNSSQLYVADDGFRPGSESIGISARIGVESAGADALLPYRFYVKDNKFVSGKNV